MGRKEREEQGRQMAQRDHERWLQAQRYPGDVVPVGDKLEFTKRVRDLVGIAGDQIREGLADESTVKDFVKTVKLGVRDPRNKTCLNLYAQVMKLIGEERRVIVEFVNRLGARSEDDLRRYVETAKSVEGVGPHDGAERCVAYLEAYFNAYPEQRHAAIKRLGGLTPVEPGV